MIIAHLADIQIRAHSRHEEYRQSFEYLYESLRSQHPDRIVLAGDIVHNKINISPELVSLTSNFFRSLSFIAPVDLILGNHDLAMKNTDRMDAITPIVDALDNEYINFMRESCVYPFRVNTMEPECQYVVMSCIDSEDRWEQIKQEALQQPHKVNIALWHGTVNGVCLESGRQLESPHDLELFRHLDYAMLGDIHATQILDSQQRIAYPGSYPKQSFSEDERGGYFLWDIRGKNEHSIKFIELPSVCPFYTIELPESLEVPLGLKLKSSSRIRIKSRPLNAAEKKQTVDQIRHLYCPSELKFSTNAVDAKSSEVVISKGISAANLRELPVQERLLREHLHSHNLTEQQLESVFLINKECSVGAGDVLRDVRYKIKSLKFSNLFSFGPDNVLDFTKLKGIVGVFGKNASGKSSLAVDAILYCLFNTVSKDVVKNQQYVNDRQDYCSAEIEIEAGRQYRIARRTDIQETKKRNGTAETKSVTDLKFHIDNQPMDDIDRAATDKLIRSTFGTVEDFLLTSVAAQFDLLGFIANKATDRKRTIGRYFDLDLFEQKHKLANDNLKYLRKRLNSLESVDFLRSIADIEKQTSLIQDELSRAEKQAHSDRKLYEYGLLQLQKISIDQETSVAQKKMQAANIKNEFLQNRSLIESFNSEIDEVSQYRCLDNPDCCMNARKISLEAKKNKAIELREAIRSRMNEFMNDQKTSQKVDPEKERIKEQRRLCDIHKQSEQDNLRKAQGFSRDLVCLEMQLSSLQKQKTELDEVKERFFVEDLYAKAMGKDGISYQIVKNNLQRINEEISRILSEDIPFEIWLADDDKEINVYLQDERRKPRQIELCSGMEKTVAAIAVRAALISITSLPVSNVFVLDESFTSLDVEYMDALGRVLSGLRKIFDTVLIICHNEYVKDLCDHIVMVEKNNEGYSRIV